MLCYYKTRQGEFAQMKIAAIDLFCGTGGLTRGLIDAGIPVIAGYDLDKTCHMRTRQTTAAHFTVRILQR